MAPKWKNDDNINQEIKKSNSPSSPLIRPIYADLLLAPLNLLS